MKQVKATPEQSPLKTVVLVIKGGQPGVKASQESAQLGVSSTWSQASQKSGQPGVRPAKSQARSRASQESSKIEHCPGVRRSELSKLARSREV